MTLTQWKTLSLALSSHIQRIISMSELDNFDQRFLYRFTGWSLVIESFLLLLPLIILGNAINWPQSLENPAEIMLPLLDQKLSMVRLGYLIYLTYSILFWVISAVIYQILRPKKSYSIGLIIALGFALISTLARCLGIIRWLSAMPTLAKLYVNPDSSQVTLDAIAVSYQTLNDYAGSVGEIFGVSLFAALWLALVSIRILQARIISHWLGFFGLFAATLLAIQSIQLFDIDLGLFNTLSSSVLQFWFLAMGISLLWGDKQSPRRG